MEKKYSKERSLIDCHAHLNEIDQIDMVIEKAQAQGVEKIVAVGMDIPSNQRTLELAEQFPDIIYPAVGYHPWSIEKEEIEETLSFLGKHLDQCVALGEVGLDYKVKIKKPVQQEVFSRVLHLAKERKKPVIVHSRFSHLRCHSMVSDAGIEKAVFHWYSGPIEILNKIIKDGYFVSATPALAYSTYHRAAIEKAPLEQILIETDSPVIYQGKKSEPYTLVETLRLLSELKKVPEDELANITRDNAQRFFGI